MQSSVRNYLSDTARQFGEGWNRFWFTPSDPLPLGALRIATGLLVLYGLATYTPDLDRFFGPVGILTLDRVRALPGGDYRFSLFDYAGSYTELQVFHAAALALVGLFTLGVFTRITGPLAWLAALSYFHRGVTLTWHWEPIAAMLLAYLCIGPSGATLSVDAWRRRRRDPNAPLAAPPVWYATVSLRLIQVHVSAIYLMMALAKLSGDVWWDGTAVWWLATRYESRLVDWTGILGASIYLTNLLTHGIVAFELTWPVMIWNRAARPLWLAASVVSWAVLASLTGLGLFAALMFVAGGAYLDGDAWRWLGSCCGGCRRLPDPAASTEAAV